MYPGIQVVRFFAAAGVLIFHYSQHAAVFGIVSQNIGNLFDILARGVAVFFALSGFLMAMLLENAKPSSFIIHRIFRIYPAYLFVLFLAWFKWGSYSVNYVFSALLIPSHSTTFILGGVEWSLFYEVFFYAVTAGLIFVRKPRLRQAIIVGWLIVVVLVETTSLHFLAPKDPGHPSLTEIPFSFMNVIFIGGMFLWWWGPRFEKGALILLFGGIAALSGAEALGPELRGWALGNACAACIFILAATCKSTTTALARYPRFVGLGDGSYGIYLIHMFFFASVIPFVTIKGVPVYILLVMIGLLVGYIFGKIEFSIYKFFMLKIKTFVLKKKAERLQEPVVKTRFG